MKNNLIKCTNALDKDIIEAYSRRHERGFKKAEHAGYRTDQSVVEGMTLYQRITMKVRKQTCRLYKRQVSRYMIFLFF